MFPENDILPVHIEVVNNADAADALTSWYDKPMSSADTSTPNETTFDSIVVADLDSRNFEPDVSICYETYENEQW